MVHIEKLYFDLEEIAERWRVRIPDLAYMAENGELRVSVRLYNVHLEEGVYELDTRDGHPHRIPFDQSWFSGLQDLTACDAHRAFRDGEVRVVHFDAPGDAYVAVMEPTDFVTVRLGQLVIRREERDRIEAAYGRAGNSVAEGFAFQHTDDYRQIRIGDLQLSLGQVQAKVVKHLHEASTVDDGWRHGKAVLTEAGSSSNRMSDVFKSQPRWRELIESDSYRKYRLRIKLR